MENDTLLQPVLAGIARHAITTLGGALVSAGYMQSSQMATFVGGGMVVAGVAWSWWQKSGQKQIAAMLKKVTGAKTTDAAVKAAENAEVKK